ncbi:MAG: undecaprenyl-diphosphate phosphatase [Ruminococcus sp.]|nr:undecaprenyl-diphosphate phosphatase [Ruminococcus sp.]
MGFFNAVMQAIIQGLTEFLPVSSSGHLSLYQHFTGNSGEGALFFSAVLHFGTLVAVFVAFRVRIMGMVRELGSLCKDIVHKDFHWNSMNDNRRMLVMIFFSCCCLLPFAPFLGWFESFSEDSSILAEGICFLYTATILFMSDRCVKGKKTAGDIKVKDSLTIGFMQGVAMLPGVSRSGSTISAGLFCKMTRETCVEYSFILGIPVILLGCLKEFKDAVQSSAEIEWGSCFVGFIVAAAVGLGAIKMVSWLVKSDKFKVFAYYTGILGVAVILIAIIEKIIGHAITFG